MSSGLLHDGLTATYLTLDLFSRPSSRPDCPWCEFTVGLGLLDHSSDKVGPERFGKLTIRECIGQIARFSVSWKRPQGEQWAEVTYPMTPIVERMRDSLRFMSWEIMLRSSKMVWT
jgi:hypothetical protein